MKKCQDWFTSRFFSEVLVTSLLLLLLWLFLLWFCHYDCCRCWYCCCNSVAVFLKRFFMYFKLLEICQLLTKKIEKISVTKNLMIFVVFISANYVLWLVRPIHFNVKDFQGQPKIIYSLFCESLDGDRTRITSETRIHCASPTRRILLVPYYSLLKIVNFLPIQLYLRRIKRDLEEK